MSKLKDAVKSVVFRFIKPQIVNNSHAQAGEDRVIKFLLSSMGIYNISYIDIGANDPILGNNTYLFYKDGSKGVIIEPDPNYYNNLKQIRPNDIIIQAAINDVSGGEADFYIFNEPTLNTLSKEEATLREQSDKFRIVETKKIKLLSVENIISQYLDNQTPHLISLDVEGVDFKVLNAFDFEKYPVPIWIIETCEYSENHIKPKVLPILDLMKTKGYFIYSDTYINTIFVNEKWFENYK